MVTFAKLERRELVSVVSIRHTHVVIVLVRIPAELMVAQRHITLLSMAVVAYFRNPAAILTQVIRSPHD